MPQALGPPGINRPPSLLLSGPCPQLTGTVTPIPSQVWGAGPAALPRKALHIPEARLITGVLGAFTVAAKVVPVTLAVGCLEWVADYRVARRLNH